MQYDQVLPESVNGCRRKQTKTFKKLDIIVFSYSLSFFFFLELLFDRIFAKKEEEGKKDMEMCVKHAKF